MENLLENRSDAQRLLGGISLRKLEYLIAEKKLKIVRVGRRVFVLRRSIEEFVRKNAE